MSSSGDDVVVNCDMGELWETYPYLKHGSENSLDNDVVFLFPGRQLPDRHKCLLFCNYHKSENRNIMTIDPQYPVVRECLKGLPDELNNSLLYTFNLHPQQDYFREKGNPIQFSVERVMILKVVRALRSILSRLSRTQFRVQIKMALRSNDLSQYISVLKAVDFNNVKSIMDVECCKSIAFQLSQTFCLISSSEEIWTKNQVSHRFPDLARFMNREKDCTQYIHSINEMKDATMRELEFIQVHNLEISRDVKKNTLNIILPKCPLTNSLNSLTNQCTGIIIDMFPGFEKHVHFGLDVRHLLSLVDKTQRTEPLVIVLPFLYADELVICHVSYDPRSAMLTYEKYLFNQMNENIREVLNQLLSLENPLVRDHHLTFVLSEDETELILVAARNKYTNICFLDDNEKPLSDIVELYQQWKGYERQLIY